LHAARVIGGTLTSRPKTLIHVTVGRILGAPEGMAEAQAAELAALVERYNLDVLPAVVAAAAPRSFTLNDVSLVRDSVWLMTEFEEYARWPIGSERALD